MSIVIIYNATRSMPNITTTEKNGCANENEDTFCRHMSMFEEKSLSVLKGSFLIIYNTTKQMCNIITTRFL
jgi:hypothetical protein